MSNITLREIEVDFQALEDLLCETEGEVGPVMNDWLMEFEKNLTAKAVSYVYVSQKLEALAEINRNFAKQYLDRARVFEGANERLRERLREVMLTTDRREIAGEGATIKLVRSIPRVDVHNEALIPDQFFRTERVLEKKKVLEALKAGEAVPGARMVETTSIRMKLEVK